MHKTLLFVLTFLILILAGQVLAQNNTQMKSLPLDAHMSTQSMDDLPGLLRNKYIRVLTTVNRTNFFIHDGYLVGYEYDLLKAYEKWLNKHNSYKDLQIVLEFIPVARDELIPNLVNGYGDIAAAGLTITKERQRKVAFSRPYLTGIKELIVTSKNGFQPQKLEDLSGKKVYVRQSSSYYQSLEDLNTRLRREEIKPVRIKLINEEMETASILEMVNSHMLGITVADSYIAQAWSQILLNIQLHTKIPLRTGGQIAWMVRKNNPKLLSSINEFLKTHKKGTLLGNIYFQRYYKDVEKLKDIGEFKAWEDLGQKKKIIKKYAKRYNIDWLLILAMAFQESGLDQHKRSKAGAVGIMQILPSTARDTNIDIQHIDKLENNVHAGVKYLHFLRKQYFSNDNIRPRDQIRLALAAYNAGPGNIRRARKLAEKMGLNKNIWFRNVELAVLRIIGQETVRYVSNINKYYILYQSLERHNR